MQTFLAILLTGTAGWALWNYLNGYPPQPAAILNDLPFANMTLSFSGSGITFDNSSGDIDTLARTAWGEDRGGGAAGMQAVMNCIINRYNLAQSSVSYARQFGGTITQICQKPAQFAVWSASDPNYAKMEAVTDADPQFSTALSLARQAVAGNLPDITGGALYYRASWASIPDGTTITASVGGNTFFNYV